MPNIPTELLRTFVAVVDLRSFTKAAQSLGITQPAVSAQIKRLQTMLNAELLDKTAPGVTLTSSGELVVNYARRLLSINDQIVHLAAPHADEQTLRIGSTGDFTLADLAMPLAALRVRHPQLRFFTCSGLIETLLRDLREGVLDLVIWVAPTGPAIETRHYWTEELVWLRGAAFVFDAQRPVPLVSYGDECAFTRGALRSLSQAGLEGELVLSGPSIAGLGAAIAAGLGVTALPRNRARLPGTVIWEDAPLPKLPETFCGIYVREGTGAHEREDIAAELAAHLRPATSVVDAPVRVATPAA